MKYNKKRGNFQEDFSGLVVEKSPDIVSEECGNISGTSKGATAVSREI